MSGPKGRQHRSPHELCGRICYCSWPPNFPTQKKSGGKGDAKRWTSIRCMFDSLLQKCVYRERENVKLNGEVGIPTEEPEGWRLSVPTLTDAAFLLTI